MAAAEVLVDLGPPITAPDGPDRLGDGNRSMKAHTERTGCGQNGARVRSAAMLDYVCIHIIYVKYIGLYVYALGR